MEKSTKVFSTIFYLICLVCLVGLTSGCTQKGIGPDETLAAIDTVRTVLSLPLSPLEFIGTGNMINAPSGALAVENYRDAQGRQYSFDPESGRLVEMDARALLPARSDESNAEPVQDLESLAASYARQLIPDFEARSASLAYEAGSKGENYFFTWYGEMQPGDMNRPFLQFGMHKSGLLFAYYNTLALEQ